MKTLIIGLLGVLLQTSGYAVFGQNVTITINTSGEVEIGNPNFLIEDLCGIRSQTLLISAEDTISIHSDSETTCWATFQIISAPTGMYSAAGVTRPKKILQKTDFRFADLKCSSLETGDGFFQDRFILKVEFKACPLEPKCLEIQLKKALFLCD
jgi:hypothetical protein